MVSYVKSLLRNVGCQATRSSLFPVADSLVPVHRQNPPSVRRPGKRHHRTVMAASAQLLLQLGRPAILASSTSTLQTMIDCPKSEMMTNTHTQTNIISTVERSLSPQVPDKYRSIHTASRAVRAVRGDL